MFCRNCGAQVKDSNLFCEKCGARLQPLPSEEQPTEKAYEPEQFSADKPKKKQTHKVIYIILSSIMGVLLLVVILEMLYLNKLDKETEDYVAPEVISSTTTKASEEESGEAEKETDKENEKIEITATPTQTVTPVPTGEPVPTLQTTVSPTQAPVQQDYIFADSSSSYLTENEVRQLTPEQMSYARNEIYARHGRKFRDEALQAYFDAKPWYHPEYEPDAFDAIQDTLFNEYEKENVKLISRIEQEVKNGN